MKLKQKQVYMIKTGIKIFILTFLSLIGLSCKYDSLGSKKAKELSDYKSTIFVPTLESSFDTEKNSIYCATLLFAWNEIKEEIKEEIEISTRYRDLTLINNSKSHIGVLQDNEYSVSYDITEDYITANAEFSKSLPFEIDLTGDLDNISFEKTQVQSFGVYGVDYERSNLVKILYYKDDDNFIISLQPKDKSHEIILIKREFAFTSMQQVWKETERLLEEGDNEKQLSKTSWKYQFLTNDYLVIPKIEFNIKTNFKSIEGNTFSSGDNDYLIEGVTQRTAFCLNESGAKVQSESKFTVCVDETENVEEPTPKEMQFNKPFAILLKRKDSRNPYFGLWVANTELMIK